MNLRHAFSAALNPLRRCSPLWNMLVRLGTSAGVTLENISLLGIISRPWWFYRAEGRVPRIPIETRLPQVVTSEDIVLCERLIAAFTAATDRGEATTASGIWRWIFDTHQRQIADMLDRRDAVGLAHLLASMFQEEFVSGVMGDAALKQHETRLGARLVSLKSLDSVVSLAEAVGVVPVENPAQGQAGLAFDGGVAKLMAGVDEALGFKVDFPNIGAPYGLDLDGRLITLDTPEQIYAALRLDHARRNHLRLHPESSIEVVEIGGGYGGMCYWFLRMRPRVAAYTIIDLPIANVLQGYFLSKALGQSSVSFFGEDRQASLRILPDSALVEVHTPFDILVNKDSMPEMPHDTMTSYLEWARVNCDGFFFSYNQEAMAEFPLIGVTQGVVSAEIERLGGFDRVRRDHSWLRRGYVEEIYLPVSERQSAAKASIG